MVATIEDDIDGGDYAAPAGTLWSWPGPNRRFRLRASAQLFVRLSEAAQHCAEPEICSHLHLYRGSEPLLNWFDAFDDPIRIAKTIARDRLERFCAEAGGVLSDAAR